MGTYHLPSGPGFSSRDIERFATAVAGDRRSFLRRAAALGIGAPALSALRQPTWAQEETPEAMDGHGMTEPEGGYVGSDPESASTGDASPAPSEVQPFTLYDPFLAPVEAGPKEITIVAQDATLYVAKDVPYAAWTFDGTVPGRALRARVGDEISFTFKIDPAATTGHSVDFHSAQTAPDKNYKTILPGEEFAWTFTPRHAGAYMYHCGTPPVLMHIGAGMYGAMVIDPEEGWSPAQELVLVQSDFYLADGENGVKVPDYTKMLGNGTMDYVAFNGYANQYVENPIKVKVGEPIRIFVVNAGPNVWSTFHVVGAIFDRGYVNANPKNEMFGLQSIAIGPGDGACIEFTIDEPGVYPMVNHAFGHAAHGAVGLLQAE